MDTDISYVVSRMQVA